LSRLRKRDNAGGHLKRADDILFARIAGCRKLGYRRLAPVLLDKKVFLCRDIGRGALETAADLYNPVVTEKALYFADDKRHGVCGEPHLTRKVKILYRLKHPYRAYLNEVLVLRAPAAEPQRYRADKPHVGFYQLVQRLGIA